jgi:hypothetical protein
MSEAGMYAVTARELLHQSWRMLRTHLLTFISLTGFSVGAMLLSFLVMYFVLVPIRPGMSLRDVWIGMSEARKGGIFLLYLAVIAVINRVSVASIISVREFHDGHEIGAMRALGCVRRKHLRVFWLLFLAGMFSIGPLVIIGLPLTLYFAPALPVATLENLGVFGALRRSNELSRGGRGRIALLFVLYLTLLVGGGFGLVGLFASVPQLYDHAWFRIPTFALGFWTFLLIPQWYMITLTLNYFDQRVQKGEWDSKVPAA